MRGSSIFSFIFVMWVLIIMGGGVLVFLIAPITVSGFGMFDGLISSGIKAIISIGLVIVWIFILYKMKKLIFDAQLKGN